MECWRILCTDLEKKISGSALGLLEYVILCPLRKASSPTGTSSSFSEAPNFDAAPNRTLHEFEPHSGLSSPSAEPTSDSLYPFMPPPLARSLYIKTKTKTKQKTSSLKFCNYNSWSMRTSWSSLLPLPALWPHVLIQHEMSIKQVVRGTEWRPQKPG